MIYKPDFESFLAECVNKVYFSSTSRFTEFYVNFEIECTAFNTEGNAIAYITEIGSTIKSDEANIQKYRKKQMAISIEMEVRIQEAGFQPLHGVISEERKMGSSYKLKEVKKQ